MHLLHPNKLVCLSVALSICRCVGPSRIANSLNFASLEASSIVSNQVHIILYRINIIIIIMVANVIIVIVIILVIIILCYTLSRLNRVIIITIIFIVSFAAVIVA